MIPPASAGSVLDSRYSWIRLAVTLLSATVGSVGMWAIIAVMPAVPAECGIERSGAAPPYAVTMIGFALGKVARAGGRWIVSA